MVSRVNRLGVKPRGTRPAPPVDDLMTKRDYFLCSVPRRRDRKPAHWDDGAFENSVVETLIEEHIEKQDRTNSVRDCSSICSRILRDEQREDGLHVITHQN